uniref:Secreted protein n=1 Tax=Macrostomum lignano TaxID=282301 RepID=A0A1I8FLI8_9PLAT
MVFTYFCACLCSCPSTIWALTPCSCASWRIWSAMTDRPRSPTSCRSR